MKFEFKPRDEAYGSCDGFWYDLTDGGYIKPTEFLVNLEQVKAVEDAVKLLESFKSQAEEAGVMDFDC